MLGQDLAFAHALRLVDAVREYYKLKKMAGWTLVDHHPVHHLMRHVLMLPIEISCVNMKAKSLPLLRILTRVAACQGSLTKRTWRLFWLEYCRIFFKNIVINEP
jgi:hypothetical protein